MAHRTALAPRTAEQDPPDIETMRRAVNRLIDPDAVPDVLPVVPAEIGVLTLQLCGHLRVLVPDVERAAQRLPRNSVARYCTLACLGDARERLLAKPSQRYGGPIGHARRLARALNGLIDHFEQLAGGCP